MSIIILVRFHEAMMVLLVVLMMSMNMMRSTTMMMMRIKTSCIRPGTSLTISLCSTSNITT